MPSFAAPTSSEWNDILAGKNGNTFVILKIEKKNISVLHTGKGLAELKKILSTPESEESVLGIGFVVYGVDNRGGMSELLTSMGLCLKVVSMFLQTVVSNPIRHTSWGIEPHMLSTPSRFKTCD